MKLSEMNAHQREAYRWIMASMSEFIGGYENTMMDYPEDDEEYQTAKAFLSRPHDELIEFIYNDVMAGADKGMARHLRFAGTEWIKERISKRLTKWGY